MANQFILQDGAGRPRAILSTGEGGAVGLFLLNADGTQLAAQFAVPEGGFANLAFYNSSGKIEWLARHGRNQNLEDPLATSKILPRWN